MPTIKVEPFLMKKGNRVAKGAIEFNENDGVLKNFTLIGFTICEDKDRKLFVLFPASITRDRVKADEDKPFFFLRPRTDNALQELQDAIIDVYEHMTSSPKVSK